MRNSEMGMKNSELSMHWASDLKTTNLTRTQISDEKLELLGQRYQANHICYLLDITFEVYLLAAKGWDRIANHLDDGGGLPVRGTQTGCRMERGQMVINQEASHA